MSTALKLLTSAYDIREPIEKVPASYWNAIDESMIATTTRLTKGSGGPSQLDAEQFCHIILSKKFKKELKDLREQIILLAKKRSYHFC